MADIKAGAISVRKSLMLSVLLGAVAATGLAPLSMWPLTVVALTLALSLIARSETRRAATLSAWAFGVGWFALGLSWIVEPFLVDIARHGWMAPFALIFMAGGLALFWGSAGWLGHRLGSGTGRIWALAVALTAAEYLRSVVLTGFPWNLIGHVWVGTGVDQMAAVTGAHGLTLLTCLAAALAARAWSKGAGTGLAALIAVLGLSWGGGAGLTRALPAVAAAPNAPVIRLVQPNAPQHEKWDPEKMPIFFDRQLGFTGAGEVPDLVVWPETSVPIFLEYPGTVLEQMAEAARGAPVVFGVQRLRQPRYYNSLVVMTRGALISEIYDKHHLVPFGEYVPLSGLMARFGIHGLAANEGGGYSAGEGLRIIDLPGIGPTLPLICYEGIFPHELGRYETRPRLMTLITNDAWFGQISGPYQHLAQARLRSIEQGLPMVRVANTGISAMIGPRGTLIDPIPLGEAGYRDIALPPALPPTLYARWGDWPMILLLVAALAGLAAYPRSVSSLRNSD